MIQSNWKSERTATKIKLIGIKVILANTKQFLCKKWDKISEVDMRNGSNKTKMREYTIMKFGKFIVYVIR